MGFLRGAAMVCAASWGCSAAAGKTYDVGSDPALHEAVQDVLGFEDELSRETQACLRRLEAPLEGIVIVGQFGHDLGCKTEGYFADGHWVNDVEDAALGLKVAGWADSAAREALALAWVEHALAPSALMDGTAKLQPDGSVLVVGRRDRPVGMTPVLETDSIQVRFTESGRVKTEVLETTATQL